MIKLELEYQDAVRLREIAYTHARVLVDDKSDIDKDQGMWTFIYVQLTNAIYPPEETDDSFLEMEYEDRFRADIDVYGTAEHEAWLIEMERQEG